jgi:hypothetical protein
MRALRTYLSKVKINHMKFVGSANRIPVNVFIILIVFAVASFTTLFAFYLTKQATAQTESAYIEQLKVLLNDTIQALQKGDTDTALVHLKLADQQTATTTKDSLSQLQTIKMLIADAIQALQKGDANSALVHLKLADQQLPSYNANKSQQNMNNTTKITFSTYNDPILGITLQYPSDWIKNEYSYNPATNNTVVSFFSQSKSASALGNVSGVSGNFVPYVDLFVFPSKNVSLDEAVNETVNNFDYNTIHVNVSKPITLKDNVPAHMLVYDTLIANDEHFKKMQVWASSGDKIYIITYTSEASLYPNYLPIIQKMIQSVELKNSQHQKITNNPITNNLLGNNTQQGAEKKKTTPAAKPFANGAEITGNTTTGVPWLP